MRRVTFSFVTVGLAVAGCVGAKPGPVVDGWDVGSPVVCVNDECAQAIEVATHGLDLCGPSHPPIADVMVYNRGKPVVHQPTIVVVFHLADGSARAIGVGSVGVSRPVPWVTPERPMFPGGDPPDSGGDVPGIKAQC